MKTFEPRGLGLSIFKERYARTEDETWEEGCRRVASNVSLAEENGKIKLTEEKFFKFISSGLFMPGGRIWYGSGRPAQQLLNCFVLPTGDSREAWGKSISDTIIVSGMGGGCGLNFSPIRGRNYPIMRMGGHATGAVSLMQMIDRVGDELVAGGSRRIALMMCLDINHPDIEEFTHVKLDLGQLNNANISIVIPPDYPTDKLIEDIRNNNEVPLRFSGRPDVLERKVRMGDLWKIIVKNAHLNGEPGVLNQFLSNEQSNISYAHSLVSSNPCGEINLPNYGCCDLGALVLPQFVINGKFDFDIFEEAISVGVRFLDNVLSINHYPLPEIKQMSENERRIGLGVMGLHSMLMDLGMRYDSPESFEFIDKLFTKMKNSAYHASVDLAIEKGPFPLYEDRFLEGGFAKKLKPALKRRIREYGIRNCALLTIAPTGTTSMVHNVTGGIEPLFAPVYIRRRYVKTKKTGEKKLTETLVVSSDHLDHKELAQGAYDISVRSHFEMQKICQKHIDNAVSKTINLPKNMKSSELSELWLEFLPFMKGSTFYREGSRKNEPMEHIPLSRANKVISEWKGEIEYQNEGMDCPNGVCDLGS